MSTKLHRLHVIVDECAAAIAEQHRGRLHCRRGCADCCVDGIGVFAVEASLIVRRYGELLAHGVPHPVGACAFLDGEGACRIYEHRPYVCRTQGLPLRWLDQDATGEPVERRDICPLNEEGPPIEQLPPESCWTLGPFEHALQELQREHEGGRGAPGSPTTTELRRVELRSLFQS